MSFDLFFYKRITNPVTESDVVSYLKNNLPFNISNSNRQWDYENPETGVYFVIEHSKIEDDEQEEFEGFIFLNFTFSLNFLRPDFFALESFPVIDKVVDDLDLFLFNSQDFGDHPVPSKFPENHLRDEWIQHNRSLALDYFEKVGLKYMSAEKSNYLWNFQFQREVLQKSLGEDIYVSSILILESEEDKKLYTMCVWPKHIPVILPKVDYVIIDKEYRSFFKDVVASGLVPYDSILKKMRDSFEVFEHDISDLQILRPEKANNVKSKFNKLKIECSIIEFGKLIATDKFVNVRPQ